jgi:hypothetical protein
VCALVQSLHFPLAQPSPAVGFVSGGAADERRRVMASETQNAAGGAMWALATVLIVLLVVGLLYFGGVFSNRKSIDININKPGLVLPVGQLIVPGR